MKIMQQLLVQLISVSMPYDSFDCIFVASLTANGLLKAFDAKPTPVVDNCCCIGPNPKPQPFVPLKGPTTALPVAGTPFVAPTAVVYM